MTKAEADIVEPVQIPVTRIAPRRLPQNGYLGVRNTFL